MSYSFVSETRPKARKQHSCIWCRENIEAGQEYVKQAGSFDGEFQSNSYHPECIIACQKHLKEYGEDCFEPHASKRGSTEQA